MQKIEKTIQKIGGKSYGILLPKFWIDALGMKEGTKIILLVSETEINIRLHHDEDYACPF